MWEWDWAHCYEDDAHEDSGIIGAVVIAVEESASNNVLIIPLFIPGILHLDAKG